MRSSLTLSGRMIITSSPNTAPARASPMPWLPLVGSTITVSCFTRPSAMAFFIMLSAVRVFMEPPTLRPSNFTKISAAPLGTILLSLITGVLPTASSMVLCIIIALRKMQGYLQFMRSLCKTPRCLSEAFLSSDVNYSAFIFLSLTNLGRLSSLVIWVSP